MTRDASPNESRRAFLRRTFHGIGLAVLGPTLVRCTEGAFDFADVPGTSRLDHLGPLLDPDANGLRLPAGFTSRIVGRTGEPVAGSDYYWHDAPDGGATFALPDGGYVYVSNAELFAGSGGAGAIRFDRDGNIVDAYPVLEGTTRNCAGGPTPWGTWLSCEEYGLGLVWECDPRGRRPAREWPALGVFSHEAAAVDPATFQIYLTEDRPDGRFYRFTPAAVTRSGPDLSSGTLEVLRVVAGDEGPVVWEVVADPTAATTETRLQAPNSSAFDGGEGIWFHEGLVYFTTKGDNRVWKLDVAGQTLAIVYDAADFASPVLTGVDNLTVTAAGDLIVAEDGGDMQVVAITASGQVVPLVQIVGHLGSEVTGVALDPHRRRLYLSSQRAPGGGGLTYEISGPFFV